MSRPVLGINFGTHDAAASVVYEGRVLAAVEEERLTRIKHTKAFPSHAIRWCLSEVGIDAQELDSVALFVDPKLQLLLPFTNLWYGFPASLGSLGSDLNKYHRRRRLRHIIRESGIFPSDIPVKPVPHHLAHAASAYLTSPFDDALVVTLDGRGEYETACIYDGSGGRLQLRHRIVYPHSFGYLYSALTRYLGFRPQRDEYKVMGLAAYGTDRLVTQVSKLAHFDLSNGMLKLELRYFDHHRRPSSARNLYSPALVDLLGPPREPGEDITDRHRDIARALQRLLEQLVDAYLAFAQQLVPRRSLCLAGGVALNCVANAAIIASGRFDHVYIQPAAGDAGTSIGAALIKSASTPTKPKRDVLSHAFLGPAYSESVVTDALKCLPSDYVVYRVNDPCRAAARVLHEGCIIGWYQGRMEFGPRALGARSILASPFEAATIDRINALIKRREMFRPLAPAVLAEAAGNYFDIDSAGEWVYPFMLSTTSVKADKWAQIPAVVHVDGSARIQTVDSTMNSMFWRLLHAYYCLSGVPVLLNTSFNEADEPIVCTPSDAVRTFTRCGLDALVIESYVVFPKESKAGEAALMCRADEL